MRANLSAETKIQDVMHTPVIVAPASVSLREAARVLRDANIGALALVDGEEPVGILSERDIVRAVADGADVDQVWVADVASQDPRYLTPVDTKETALTIMHEAGVRHLPVVDEGQLVGMVSLRDVAGATGARRA